MRGWWFIGICVMLLMLRPAAAQQSSGQSIPLPGADAFDRAQQALRAQDYDRAALEASLFILLNPSYSRGYYLRGVIYAQTGDYARALADLDRAAAFPAPDTALSVSLYSIRSLLHAQQGDAEAALADLNTGIEVVPDAAVLFVSRADLYAAVDELDAALADYDRALELDDGLAAAYGGRGRVYLRRDDLPAALADYDRALELNPDDAAGRARRASIYLRQGEADAALADLDAALRLTPDDAGLYLSRGAAYALAGRQPDAAADFRQWLAAINRQTANYPEPLRPGESVIVPLAAGRLYRFTFEAQAGQTLRLTAAARDGAATDPLIVLLNPAGEPVAADDDSGGGFNALISAYPAPDSGVYTLLVGHAGGSPDGAVRVRLEVVLQ